VTAINRRIQSNDLWRLLVTKLRSSQPDVVTSTSAGAKTQYMAAYCRVCKNNIVLPDVCTNIKIIFPASSGSFLYFRQALDAFGQFSLPAVSMWPLYIFFTSCLYVATPHFKIVGRNSPDSIPGPLEKTSKKLCGLYT
jgi:hypothetical protein